MSHPPLIYPGYKSSLIRGPQQGLIPVAERLHTVQMPVYGESVLGPLDHDLTRNGRQNGEPLGERILVAGRVTDEAGRPLRRTLIEVWQANSAGRYIHKKDQHDAPLDPNFLGGGRTLTDDEGRYRFYTIKPGAYPWGNHPNAWRPMHIHFSLLGPHLESRLITQVYFPGDPLLAYDPIFQSVPEAARERLIAQFRLDWTEPGFALAYEFNLVLRGRAETPFENRE